MCSEPPPEAAAVRSIALVSAVSALLSRMTRLRCIACACCVPSEGSSRRGSSEVEPVRVAPLTCANCVRERP